MSDSTSDSTFPDPIRYFTSDSTFSPTPWVCLIKVCSNGGGTYIIGEIIAENNLNIVNLMQNFENLLLQNY